MNAIASTYFPWDETSIMINPASNQILLSHEEFTSFQGTEGMYTFSFFYLFCLIYLCSNSFVENFPALIMGYGVTDSADIRSKGLARINKCSLSGIESSSKTLPSSEIPEQGKQAPLLHGNPQIIIFYYICHRLEFQESFRWAIFIHIPIFCRYS